MPLFTLAVQLGDPQAYSFCLLQVFLNLTKDLSKGERTSTELPEEVPTCILDKDEMNADNFTEKDGIDFYDFNRSITYFSRKCYCKESVGPILRLHNA